MYGAGRRATIGATVAEIATHPIRSAGTILRALGDAVQPGEPMAAGGPGRNSSGRRWHRSASRGGCAARACGTFTVTSRTPRQPWACMPPDNSACRSASPGTRTICFSGAALAKSSSASHLRRLHQRVAPRILPQHRPVTGGARYHVIRCGVDVDSWTPKADAGKIPTPNRAHHHRLPPRREKRRRHAHPRTCRVRPADITFLASDGRRRRAGATPP